MLTEIEVGDIQSASAAVNCLQECGAKCIVLTLGEKGLMYTVQVVNKEGVTQWSKTEHVEAKKTNVIDTTVSSATNQSTKTIHFVTSITQSVVG